MDKRSDRHNISSYNINNYFSPTLGLFRPFVQAATILNDANQPIGDVYVKRLLSSSIVPFKYSKLALGLSICILSQLLTTPQAYAATSDTENSIENSIENAEALTDKQLEEALVALKLKQAVEQGIIEPSVLEDYRRETLAKEVPSGTRSDTQTTINGQTAANSQTSNNISALSPTQGTVPSITCNADDEICDVDVDFDSAFTNAGSDLANVSVTDDKPLQTPAEIEALLNQVDSDTSVNFQTPVAKLNTAEPPIGLDQSIESVELTAPNVHQNNQSQSSINQSNNIQSDDRNHAYEDGSGQDNVNAASVKPTITSEGSIGYVSPDEDLTNANSNNDTDVSLNSSATDSEHVNNNDITAERIAEAQQNGAAPIINPDDYLPEYEVNSTAEAEESALIASDTEDSSASNDVGFFKRIYARLFNDGYTGLPKLRANIYIQDESRTDSDGMPLLIKADDDVQPANNIKAAMENITVEAITDFTAALPKLRDEALMAATAVGYYDVNLRFIRENNNTINVIIEQLGEPVRVNHRLVDVRGEGADLPEFTTIEEVAKPLEGDVFNHGAYKNIKASIEEAQDKLGFFDATWLNRSVDVLLPDNTADIDLIYDTGVRYHFDEVVFFTLDEETGHLTTDPDKLPIKPELLHKLYNFEAGDDFHRPKITSFTNDLSATNYFNLVNVEVVRPAANISSESTLGFSNESSQTVDNDSTISSDGINDNGINDNDIIVNGNTTENATNTDINLNNNTAEEETDSSTTTAQSKADTNLNSTDTDSEANIDNSNGIESDISATTDTSDAEDYEPIVFRVDDVTTNKLDAIAAKARRLITLPDNRVLDEEAEEARNLLGKISDAISNAVAKILPEEDDDSLANSDSSEDYEPEVLQGRKSPQEVAETKHVPLYVFVMADKPKDADIGIGYGTDTGFRFVGRLEHNLINRDGYQAGVTIGASQIKKSLEIHASRPWKHPLDDKLYGNLSYEQEEKSLGDNRPDISINTIQGGIARNIRQESGWNRTYSLRYRLDQVDSDVSGPEREKLPYPFNVKSARFNQQSLLLGYAMDKTITNNVTNPTNGWRQYYSIAGGAENVLTDTNMVIARAGVSGIYSFGEFHKHQVLGSVDTGYIWADDTKNVPFQQRFYAGGDRSIRGYDYNSLSAIDENDNLIGGEILALGSAEYNYEFKPGFRGAVFADVGNAYDKSFDTETKLGVGFGIRWASPVGMVRLDLAAGVLEDSIPIRLHFFIGSPLQ